MEKKIEKDIFINQEYLEKNGYSQDNTAPKGVNRWELQKDKPESRDYHISVTVSPDGSKALYGVINFYSVRNNELTDGKKYEYISLHRYFNGEITIADFNRMLDKDMEWKNRNPEN